MERVRPAGRATSHICTPTPIFIRLGWEDGHYLEHWPSLSITVNQQLRDLFVHKMSHQWNFLEKPFHLFKVEPFFLNNHVWENSYSVEPFSRKRLITVPLLKKRSYFGSTVEPFCQQKSLKMVSSDQNWSRFESSTTLPRWYYFGSSEEPFHENHTYEDPM